MLSENGENDGTLSSVDDGLLPADLDLTVEQIKEKLTALGIKFSAKAKKPELVELLAQAAESGQGGE